MINQAMKHIHYSRGSFHGQRRVRVQLTFFQSHINFLFRYLYHIMSYYNLFWLLKIHWLDHAMLDNVRFNCPMFQSFWKMYLWGCGYHFGWARCAQLSKSPSSDITMDVDWKEGIMFKKRVGVILFIQPNLCFKNHHIHFKNYRMICSL